MSVIDFHSHVLPGIDDGSRNVATSVEMLKLCKKNGVDVMAATPHFYASRNRMERFLQKRRDAYESLMDAVETEGIDIPKIILGAETAYFTGIGRSEDIGLLTYEGTKLILLEMPFVEWDDEVFEDIEKLLDRGFDILIAHVERYIKIPGNSGNVKDLLDMPVYIQINAESLTEWLKRGKLIKYFKNGDAHVLGSDTHGMHHREPNLWLGREVLLKKLGEGFMSQMDETGKKLLNL